MKPIKVWVIVNPEGEADIYTVHAGPSLSWVSAVQSSGISYSDIQPRIRELKRLGYTCQEMYLAPIEPSEDMLKEALKLSDDYYGPYEGDIEAIYTAMMESRDE